MTYLPGVAQIEWKTKLSSNRIFELDRVFILLGGFVCGGYGGGCDGSHCSHCSLFLRFRLRSLYFCLCFTSGNNICFWGGFTSNLFVSRGLFFCLKPVISCLL